MTNNEVYKLFAKNVAKYRKLKKISNKAVLRLLHLALASCARLRCLTRHSRFSLTFLIAKISRTIKELSEKTNISVKFLERIENATAKRINTNHAFLIADGLNIKPYKLFEE